MSVFNKKELRKMKKLWRGKRTHDDADDTTFLLEYKPNAAGEKRADATGSISNRQAKKMKKSNARNQSAADRSANLAKMCHERLAFSQFRAVNEYLYSHHSGQARSYMDEDTFVKYHQAYDELAEKWPVKPIDEVLKIMVERYPSKRGAGYTFADLGCGPRAMIKNHFKKATVHSYDLVATGADIVQADSASLPLADGVCDCVVFCLSLMGTNLRDQLAEAVRVMKKGGSLIIAEVTSRFEEDEADSVESFVKKLAEFGFKLKLEKKLPPNDYFVLFRFKLIKTTGINAAKLPLLTLKPCVYKPR